MRIYVGRARKCGGGESTQVFSKRGRYNAIHLHSLRVIPHLLASLDIEPVLLHGDLWVSQQSYEKGLEGNTVYAHRTEI